MSHSCTPNCQAVVMSCGGKLTIAVYTLRGIAPGEELTFDYASVTENEREFKCAICLCGTQDCRGSFLYFSGSRAFMQVRGKLPPPGSCACLLSSPASTAVKLLECSCS